MKIQRKAEILSEKTFLGFPSADFEKAGREQLSYLLLAGLNPDSRLVDVGCGVLRAGYWLIHLLNPGCYFGIEPHSGRLEMGVNIILELEVLKAKRAQFDTNAHFDTSVFKREVRLFPGLLDLDTRFKAPDTDDAGLVSARLNRGRHISGELLAGELEKGRLQGGWVEWDQSRVGRARLHLS